MTSKIQTSRRVKGVMTAVITPFTNGIVDYALATLADWHILFGTSALVPCGTSGEAPHSRMA
jgi:4-hydroxy-tetrahydrodipicolinate synthase